MKEYQHLFENQKKMEDIIAPYKNVLTITRAGFRWVLRGVNDLGYLYWSKVGQKKQYTLENFRVSDLDHLNAINKATQQPITSKKGR